MTVNISKFSLIDSTPLISSFLGYQKLPLSYDPVEDFAPDHRLVVASQEQIRTQRLQLFLKTLIQENEVEHSTATCAWTAWKNLSAFTNNKLPVPNVGAGPDGEILLTWDYKEHHFEMEIYSSGLAEFFYLNHLTDDVWEMNYRIGDNIPNAVRSKLDLFSLYDR